MKEVRIVIEKDGTIEAEADGFKGKGCEKVLDQFSQAIAAKAKVDKKPDYYATEKVSVGVNG